MQAAASAARRRVTMVKLELEVQYASLQSANLLPDRERVAGWVEAALEGRRDAAQLVVRIVDEDESGELNQRYRRREGPTNVLSFPFEHPELLDPPLLGDLLVCAPVVEREAREQGKPAEAHWAHMVIHGTLHLLGYDHEEADEAELMEGLERDILARLGHPDPWEAERAQA